MQPIEMYFVLIKKVIAFLTPISHRCKLSNDGRGKNVCYGSSDRSSMVNTLSYFSFQ